MELRHIRYFLAVHEAGSVNAAAVRVHVAQPSLSRQLRQLERDLGVELFDRSTGRLRLSAAGRALLPEARALMRAAERIALAAEFHARGGLRHVTIAAPTVTLTDIVAPFVATLAASDPTVDVFASDGEDIGELLARGADLVITPEGPGPDFTRLRLAELPVWAYVTGAHHWAGRRWISIAELVDQPLVLVPPDFAARRALNSAVLDSGSNYTETIEAANGTIAQALAAARRGIAVVTDDPRFDLVPLAVRTDRSLLRIPLDMWWDSSHPGSQTLCGIAERLREFIAERYGRDFPAVEMG
ncbi:LysR family transcriptional regulator [Nocardia testacea]|uniref:LysR family transcriptional regulator n=1 Tax=Nocardia testacea TaxID=248551 RepID=UPI0033CA4AE8